MELKRVNVQIAGRVQGVGYRYFAQEKAVALGLKGWVRNLPNGNVEAEAEGSQEALEAFLNFLERGPSMAHVAKIEKEWRPADHHFKSFEIR